MAISINWQKAAQWSETTEAAVSGLRLKNTDNVVMLKEPWNASLLKKRPKQSVGTKPDGLWYACGTGWLTWVISNVPAMLGEYIYKLDIDKTKLLILHQESALRDFDDKYGQPQNYANYIDWVTVADKYAGIQICPYQWRIRHEYFWYYSWDVASGCIWHPGVIRGVEQVFAR